MFYMKLTVERRPQFTAARLIHRQGWSTWRRRFIARACSAACVMMPSIASVVSSAMNRGRQSMVTAGAAALQRARPREDAQPLFECILRNVELALSHGRIHADLSAYNVLYWQGTVTLIDFAQAVDPYHNSDVFSLFARDIERTCQYFARYGVNRDAHELVRKIWTYHMGPIPELA